MSRAARMMAMALIASVLRPIPNGMRLDYDGSCDDGGEAQEVVERRRQAAKDHARAAAAADLAAYEAAAEPLRQDRAARKRANFLKQHPDLATKQTPTP